MRELSRQDLVDICRGAAVLGTGGGGAPEYGIEALTWAVDNGLTFELADVDELPDAALVACPSGVASISPGDEEKRRRKNQSRAKLLSADPGENPLIAAVTTLEQYMGRSIDAMIPAEIGGYNTAIGMLASALKGVPTVDGDPVGRAIPEVDIQSFNVFDVPIAPYVVSDAWGNRVIGTAAESDATAETVARAISVMGTVSWLVSRPVEASTLRRTFLPGTISLALRLGQAMRTAGKSGYKQVADSAGGVVLFRGKTEKIESEDREGFLWGTNTIAGQGEYQGQTMEIWFKNENLMSHIDGKPYVTCPDLISVLELDTGRPVMNSELSEGVDVAVIGIPCRELWRTEVGLKVFSPRRFGFDVPYTPLEEVVNR